MLVRQLSKVLSCRALFVVVVVVVVVIACVYNERSRAGDWSVGVGVTKVTK